jgi:predicted O-methyltransferase YrrM
MDHFYHTVEGWFNYPDMFAYAVETAPQDAHFVEIGTWKGQSSAFLAVEIVNSGKNIKLDCIDNFTGSVIEPGQMLDRDNQAGKLMEVFVNNMKPVEGLYTAIKGDSTESASLYEDESLDFVFIDASHDYKSFLGDLKAWFPKVKVGGLIGGHDFAEPYPGIRKAVTEHLANESVGVTPSTCWFCFKQNKNLSNI